MEDPQQVVLSVKNLSRRYGRRLVVNRLNFEIHRGQVFGLLGPNGSGKTTTLGMLLDVTRPSGGSYHWFGMTQQSSLVRRRIGAILERPLYYPWMSGMDNLALTAIVRGLELDKKKLRATLARVGLDKERRRPVGEYSLGMQARLSMASAILGEPEVLVLDEPTNGLDPSGIHEVRDLILEFARSGHTILLASHILSEVEKVCSHIVVLKEGQIVSQGPIKEAISSHDYVELRALDRESLRRCLQKFSQQDKVSDTDGLFKVFLHEGQSSRELSQFLFDHSVVVTHFVQKKRSLESHFLELMGDQL